MKKKNPTEIARKRCVNLAKEINKILAKRRCEYCGIDHGQMNSHHIFNEGTHKSMSADVDNLICVCVLHHGNGRFPARAGTFGFHRTPAEAMEWFKGMWPERYKELVNRTRILKQMDEYEWKKKEVELKEQKRQLLCSIEL